MHGVIQRFDGRRVCECVGDTLHLEVVEVSTTDVRDNKGCHRDMRGGLLRHELKRCIERLFQMYQWSQSLQWGTFPHANLGWKCHEFERFVLAEAAHHVRERRKADQVERSVERRLGLQFENQLFSESSVRLGS